jgi:acetyl-CoA acyltransferase
MRLLCVHIKKHGKPPLDGRFKNEIIGIEGHDANGFKVLCEIDEVIRPETTLEAISRAKTCL